MPLTAWLSQPLVDTFVELLRRRLSAAVPTTEDSIRYTFFAALLQTGTQPEQVVLEYPHPTIDRCEIDTVVFNKPGRVAAALEFKYDRTLPSGTNQPAPQRAGAVLADLVRLITWGTCPELYLVHVTDQELARYWGAPRNGLAGIFSLPCGQSTTIDKNYFSGRAPTLLKKIGGWAGPVVVSSIACEPLPNNHHLRWYRVALPHPMCACKEQNGTAG